MQSEAAVEWAESPRGDSMALQVQDFLRGYEARTDEELLRLALERDQLTADANLALSSELSRRGLQQAGR
jgi:hypothetical protein